MNALQQRAKVFLERPIPDGMDYAPDSMSERFIAGYAADGNVELDAELGEILQICVMEAGFEVDSSAGDEAEFFRESCEILKAILEESQR